MQSKEELEKLDPITLYWKYKANFGAPPVLISNENKKEKLIECLTKNATAYSLGYGRWPGLNGTEPEDD